MANHARVLLESALRERQLDRTLTTSITHADRLVGSPGRPDASALAPMGLSRLDDSLHGGLSRGHLSELAGPISSGRTTLLLRMLAAATRRGEITALVDTCDRLDVSSAVAAGVDLDRLLWIRGITARGAIGDARQGQGPQTGLFDRAVDRALKALNLVLQAGGFGVVAIDLSDLPAAALRRIPLTTWPRVQRAIEGRDTACVLVTTEPLARSAGGLTLSLAGRSTWAGASPRSRRLQGLDVRVRIVSPRKRIDADVAIDARCPISDAHGSMPGGAKARP